jgi:uncharacterized protein YceH (UPF0502 family)
LIEKEIVTPEAYPLSLNALLAACNQRSSRDPVLDVDEGQGRQALHALQEMGWAAAVQDGRVPKYEHRVRTVLNLRRDEVAVLCLLLLRGPQTPGELRARADRLYSFDGLDAVEATLARLAAEPDPAIDATNAKGPLRPLVMVLPRQPGSREARYTHLLGGAVVGGQSSNASGRDAGEDFSGATVGRRVAERIAELEAQVATLLAAVSAIEASLGLEKSDAAGTHSENGAAEG